MKKMRKKTLVMLSVICLLILTLGATKSSESEYTIDTPYEYPILPGTQAWIDLGNVFARREVCQIPEDILNKITTDALFQTVLDYPFFNDIFAFNSIKVGYEVVKQRFNGLQEFENRPDCLDTILHYYQENPPVDDENKTLRDYKIETLYLMLSADLNLSSSPYASYSIITIETPNHSYVPAVEGRGYGVKCPELGQPAFNEQTMRERIEEDKLEHPDAVLLRGAVSQNLPAYNCISYALYSQSYNNNKWLDKIVGYENGPWTYFTDESYELVTRDYPDYYNIDNLPSPKGIAQIGDVFVYGVTADIDPLGPFHVGIVNSLKFQTGVDKVISKWGAGGLWLHTWNDCPYVEDTDHFYSIWRRAK